MTTIIHIDLDALDERLDGGELWTTGWGDWQDRQSSTCLHGAIRYCQPVPGDAYLIEKVGVRFGFGVRDNDACDSWACVREKVQPDITDTMLAETFGPQWEHVVALVRRAATLTESEAETMAAAWAGRAARAAWAAARDAGDAAGEDAARAAWSAARAAVGAGDAARAAWAANYAAWDAAWFRARAAVGAAARALGLRDLIGQHGFTQDHYDTLTGPWHKAIGPVHPDDKAIA